jgi:tetratricopeptide (TPR) repeat protein
VVLVLDTYEALRHVAGPWLLDTLLGGRLTPLTGDLRLIVSGREPLQRTDPRWMRDWDTTDRAILNVDLEPFSVAETETYLGSDPQSEAAGRRPSPDDVHAAHRMTGGLPVWLALWRQAWRRAGESPDVAAAEHVQMVVDRLLMWWDDPAQLRWVRTAWAPRWFNLEILRVLLGPDAEPAFEWLTRQAAIVRGDRGRWRFHEVVRIALRHEALQRAPNELAALHDRLAEYWRGRTPASGRPAEEALYHHLLGTNPIQGAAAFCQAYVRGLAAGDPHLGRLVAAGREARAEAGPVAGLRTVAAVEAHWDALQAGDTARAAVLRDQIVALNVLPPAERALLLAERVDPHGGASDSAPLGRRPPAERPEPAEQRPRPWWRGLAGRRALTPEQRRHTEALVEYGDTLRLAGNYEAALAPLTAVVVLDPDNPHARASRGETLRALGRTAEAIEDLSAAIRLRPHESAVWSARATAYLSTNAPAKALADAQRAVELDVRNAWALAVRGLARRQANRYPTPDAVADVRRALELDPELAWARSALADWEAFLANQPAGKAAAQPDDRPAQPPDRGRQGTPGTLDPGASSAPTRSGAVLNGRRPASAPQ